MKAGEIFLAQFPFGDVAGMKLRPVLLLTGPVGAVPEVLVAYISSVIPTQLLPSDLLIDPSKPEFQSTHLKTLSTLRLHRLDELGYYTYIVKEQPDKAGESVIQMCSPHRRTVRGSWKTPPLK